MNMNADKEVIEQMSHVMLPDDSSIGSISREICLEIENLRLGDCKIPESKEQNDMHLKYLRVTRYLVLHSVFVTTLEIPFLENIQYNELNEVACVRNVLIMYFFADDFEKILDVPSDKYVGADIDYAECLLSRCLLLCSEPTYASFMLVASFLSYVIDEYVDDLKCFRIMYIVEFCFIVLYKRRFWNIFKFKEDYLKLRRFCVKVDKMFTEKSTLKELRNTTFGVDWINLVKNCVEATDIDFSFTKSEKELFKRVYWKKLHIECKTDISRKIENILYPVPEGFEMEHFCKDCDSKCHNYLEYANLFTSI